MEQQACRAQLARLLTDETSLLALLETQLQREHELLTQNDVDGLDAAGRTRQESVAKLLHLDDERRNLCRLLGQPDSQAGLAALLKWCDPTGTLAPAYTHCSEQAQRCREQNDRNGALVNARLNRVSGMLNMLNAGNGAPRTYDSKIAGTRAGTINPGRMVSFSA